MKKLFYLCIFMIGAFSLACFFWRDFFHREKHPLDFDSDLARQTERATKEIENRLYLTLATANKEASPWNSPVYTAFDKHYRFYWISDINSQHSKNIRENDKTFAVIYNSTAPEGTGFGVYLRGRSHELNQDDLHELNTAITLLGKRIHREKFPPPSDFLPPVSRRIYRFTPEQIWINTIERVNGKIVDRRMEITKQVLSTK